MTISNSVQALSLAAGFSAGAVLSLFYDLLRPIRRCFGRSAGIILDICYLLLAGAVLFILAQGPGGGAVHTFYLAAAAVGGLLYLVLLRPLVCKTLDISTDFVIHGLKSLNERFSVKKKIGKIIKNIFPNEEK